jgi:hypothetical protein
MSYSLKSCNLECSHSRSYVVYFALGLLALSRDRDIERFKIEANTGDRPENLPQWLERSDSPLKPLGMKIYWPKFLRRNQERAAWDLELPAHLKHEGSRRQSQAASIDIPVSGGTRSLEEDDQSHPSSLVNSSVAAVSIYATSTIQPSTEGSTNASSSLVNPDSARSSALISSASSMLPAYCE